jgi:hypothetical protein
LNLEGEIPMAFDAATSDRETRLVDAATDGDDAPVHGRAGVEKRVTTDNDDVAVHTRLDDCVAVKDDHRVSVC